MPEESQLISVVKAREFAIYYLDMYKADIVRVSRLDDRNRIDPNSLFVEPEPSLVFDISGDLLFYDFIITSRGTGTAQIRIAANVLLGHPFVSLQSGNGGDTREMMRSALDLFYRNHPTSALVNALPVCFNYPRTGIVLWVNSPQGISSQILFDPEFPNRGLQPIPEGAGTAEGERVHSVLGEIPEGGASPADFFNLAARTLDDATHRVLAAPGGPLQRAAALSKLSLSADGDRGDSIINVPYFAQESGDFCVLACLQMLSKFFIPTNELSQADLHDVLVQPPPLYGPGGVTPEQQPPAFQRVFPGDQFNVGFRQNPSWVEAVQSIRAGLPFKSGISGHARVCVGFNEKEIGERGSGTAVVHKAIYVNDPSGPSPRLELYQIDKLSVDGSVENTRLTIPIKLNAIVVSRR